MIIQKCRNLLASKVLLPLLLILPTLAVSQTTFDLKRCTVEGKNTLSLNAFASPGAVFSYKNDGTFKENMAEQKRVGKRLVQYYRDSGLAFLMAEEFSAKLTEHNVYAAPGFFLSGSLGDNAKSAVLLLTLNDLNVTPELKSGMPRNYFERLFADEIKAAGGSRPNNSVVRLRLCGRYPAEISFNENNVLRNGQQNFMVILLSSKNYGEIASKPKATNAPKQKNTSCNHIYVGQRVNQKVLGGFGLVVWRVAGVNSRSGRVTLVDTTIGEGSRGSKEELCTRLPYN